MRECYKSRWRCTDGYFPPSLHRGEPEDSAHDFLEEVSLQMGASPRAPFRFNQTSRSSSIWSLSPEGWWACLMISDNWMHYIVHIRMTLGEGGDQPLPSYAWSGLLIADMFQDGPSELITKAVVLALGEATLFFGRWLHKEGLPYTSARNMGFSLTGQVNWAIRTVQVEATANMVQESHQSIVDAVMERIMKARGPRHPWGSGRAIWSLAGACNVDDWMWGLDEWVSDGNVRRTDDAYTWCSIGCGRQYQQQRAPRFPKGSPRGLPSLALGGGSSDRGSDWSSEQLTVTRTSCSSHGSACLGRSLWVEVNLPIIKDEKMKDAVTYHSWQWEVAIFHWSEWDNQHLLPYIFCSLQGFPGDLAWNLGEDDTLSDVLQMLDEHNGVIMTFNILSKELYSLKQGLGENVAEYGVQLSQQPAAQYNNRLFSLLNKYAPVKSKILTVHPECLGLVPLSKT